MSFFWSPRLRMCQLTFLKCICICTKPILVSKLENIQIQSFEAELPVPQIADKEGGPPTFRAVFIRAPAILEVGPEVVVLADIPVSSNKAVDPNPALESTEVCYMLLLFLF